MRSKRRSFRDRGVIVLESRMLARFLTRDPEAVVATDMIVLATQESADVSRLAEKAGCAVDRLRSLERRLREARIWIGRTVDAREWRDLDTDRERMTVILAQAKVALGALNRKLIEGAAVYTDWEGNRSLGSRFPWIPGLSLAFLVHQWASNSLVFWGAEKSRVPSQASTTAEQII